LNTKPKLKEKDESNTKIPMAVVPQRPLSTTEPEVKTTANMVGLKHYDKAQAKPFKTAF
jgi:hypothetical protein